MTDWKTFYKQHDKHDGGQVSEPDEWQVQLAELLMRSNPTTALEAGSGYGLTSLLLGEMVKKTLLDLELSPLMTARTIFSRQQDNGKYIAGDLLNMPFPDNSFDVVFNSGVLEHFSFSQRKQALQEMLRVCKSGSSIIAAIPNHFSIPYRYAYLYKQKLGRWPYPDEFKLYDFSEELHNIASAGKQERITLSVSTALGFLRRHQRILFKIRGVFQKYEGYLTVIAIQKKVG